MIKKIVKNPNEGLRVAKDLLYKYIDEKTALFLSGGTTPMPLYEVLAKEKKLRLGGAALVDERFGLSNQENSNEKMIRDTGLMDYLKSKKIPFYGILRLHTKGAISEFVKDYEEDITHLISGFSKRIAIMGIGEDGHTASLPTGVQNSKLTRPPASSLAGEVGRETQKYVVGIKDFPGEFKKRITLTFNALSKMDLLIVLVFGSAKLTALKFMFTQGVAEEIPARFYTEPGISEKTILITDQKV